jgi:hypothetical protein
MKDRRELYKNKLNSFDNSKFYSIIIKLRKNQKKEKSVSLIVRKLRKGKTIKKILTFPDFLKEDEIYWKSFQGEYISVYHRVGNYKYINTTHPENTIIPISLAQKLEKLVSEIKDLV